MVRRESMKCLGRISNKWGVVIVILISYLYCFSVI